MDSKETNKRVIEQFRAGGEIDGMRRDRLVLLTTVGAKSGLRRTTPMMFHRDGGRLLVIASNVGAPRHPDWYVNLVANPRVTVEVGADSAPRWPSNWSAGRRWPSTSPTPSSGSSAWQAWSSR